ncbi:MAG TPA: DUF1853 family protein [Oligoflexus sp.]|uniref:DUF1853 family protein n=1 Tax=Oligoflexus sp. TaxID=1971216 RepID=UPI002D802658|nr:DUF1853 family protein [Oligoflexus sp.]HET9236673.1 DUF1853 family protein [Oligoflexus sp.]
MHYQPSPSRFPWQDLHALIMDPLLLDESCPAFAGRAVSAAWFHAMQQRSVAWLQGLKQNPEPLKEWLSSQPSHRLGFYFEQLFAFWLSRMEKTSVSRHRPVTRDGRTVGELDILGLDRDTGQALHFELAIKYYLQTARDRSELCDFVGPRAQDRLDLKLERLFQKQLRLLETEDGLRAVPQDLRHRPFVSRAFVKGGLFYPLDLWLESQAPPVPIGVNRSAPLGWWLRITPRAPQEWSLLQAEKWSLLPRLEWMSRQTREHDDPELLDPPRFWEYCRQTIHTRNRALLTIGYASAGQSGLWREVTRGFLLPESWPLIMPK